MLKKITLLCVLLIAVLTGVSAYKNIYLQKSSTFTDQYPSHQCKNNFGEFDHCLRASKNLKAGTVVASANFTKTENEFIAQHESKDFRHVAIMGLKNNGKDIQWGKVNGKMALVNHSCDPNSELTSTGNVVTIKDVLQEEEITIAYDTPIMGIPWNHNWNFKCLCESKQCRLQINSYNLKRQPRTLAIIE